MGIDGQGRRGSIVRGIMCALRRGKEGEKRWNEVGDEIFVTCCDSLNLLNTLWLVDLPSTGKVSILSTIDVDQCVMPFNQHPVSEVYHSNHTNNFPHLSRCAV